jgi:hypothetical protein
MLKRMHTYRVRLLTTWTVPRRCVDDAAVAAGGSDARPRLDADGPRVRCARGARRRPLHNARGTPRRRAAARARLRRHDRVAVRAADDRAGARAHVARPARRRERHAPARVEVRAARLEQCTCVYDWWVRLCVDIAAH